MIIISAQQHRDPEPGRDRDIGPSGAWTWDWDGTRTGTRGTGTGPGPGHGTPGGWCFYDAIAVHLFPDGQEGETAGQITRGMIASYCLYLLVQRKLEYAEFFC